jgi:hypothetical protein
VRDLISAGETVNLEGQLWGRGGREYQRLHLRASIRSATVREERERVATSPGGAPWTKDDTVAIEDIAIEASIKDVLPSRLEGKV